MNIYRYCAAAGIILASLVSSGGSSLARTSDALLAEAQAPNDQKIQHTQNTIDKIEVNQGVGTQKNNNLKFVAGKSTVIRAFMSAEVTVDASAEQTQAVITRDGEQVASLSAKSYDAPTKIVEFLCPSLAACGNWAAGNYAFNVKVNGQSRDTQGATYAFVERDTVKVLALSVKGCFSKTILQVKGEDWKKFNRFTELTYPVADGKFVWEVRNEFDGSDCDKYDLDTEKGRNAIWQALTDLVPAQCKDNPKGQGCYDLVVGFIAKNPVSSGANLAGYTYGKPTNIVVATDKDAPATVAHEIAHVYGIGDTYQGGSIRCSVNPGFSGITGTLWEGESGYSQCTAQKHKDYDTILIPSSDGMYEVGGRGALPDTGDYMGSSMEMGDIWTSKFVYDYLFDKLAPPAAPALQFRLSAQRLIAYSGMITYTTGEVDLGSWQTFDGVLPEQSGADLSQDSHKTHWIAALAGNSVIYTETLNYIPNPPASRGNTTQVLPNAPFDGIMAFPANITKFQIYSGTQMLKEVIVSGNAPVVSNVSPASTGSFTGVYTVTWNASDANGDAMEYFVEYNRDVTNSNSQWIVLEGGLKNNWLAVDFADLPGGAHSKFRVIASDGILTGQADSAEMNVAYKAPDVFVDEPPWGYDYETGDEVELAANVLDQQDEPLDENNIVWTSNLSGELGRGSLLIVKNLTNGEHVITVRATNSGGLSTSKQVAIRVGSMSNEYIENGSTQTTSLINTYMGATTTLQVPGAAVYTDTLVSYTYLQNPNGGLVPGGFWAGRNFELQMLVEKDNQWEPVAFNAAVPMTLSLAYAPLPAGMSPSSLRLYRWTGSAWSDAASDCSPASTYDTSMSGYISVGICRSGSYALGAHLDIPVYKMFMPMINK